MNNIQNKKTTRKQKFTTDEPVSCAKFTINTPDKERLCWNFYGQDSPEFGLSEGDVLFWDSQIEPVRGELAIYQKRVKGKIEIGLNNHGEQSSGWRYVGMVTHVFKRIYKSTNEILSAEFLSDEIPQKRIPTAYDFD